MADSFAITPSQAVMVQPNSPGAQPLRVSGSPNLPGLSEQPALSTTANDRTSEALLKLGADILAPRLKEEATRQFMVGVERAQSGAALNEVLAEQPWYSEIFGPSSAAQGARAYTAQMNIARFGAEMERQMPKLAEQGPEALTAAASASIKQMMTGDPTTDSAITTAYVEQMAPIYKRHAKEHVAFTQRKAQEAQLQSWVTLSDAFQSRATAAARDGTMSPEDMAAERSRMLGALTPFGDQTDESYERNVTAFIAASAAKGNFHAIKMLKDEGIYDKVSVERRAQLDGVLRASARQTLDGLMPAYAEPITRLLRDTVQSPEQLVDRLEALNAEVAQVHGITEAQLVPRSTYDNAINRLLGAQESEANRRAAAEADAAADAARQALADGLLAIPGAVDRAKAVQLLKDVDIERATARKWEATTDPVARATVLNARPDGTANFARTELQTLLRGEDYNKGVDYAAQVYVKLDEGVKGRYFDEGQRRFLDNFTRQVRSGVQPDQAFATTRLLAPVAENMLPAEARTEAHKLIRQAVENKHENLFGFNTLDGSSMRMFEALTNRIVKQDSLTNDLPTAVARAVGKAYADGAQVLGKHLIVAADPADPKLEQMLSRGENNAGPKAVAEAFSALLEERAKAHGMGLDQYSIVRPKDIGGKAYFYVEAANDDGQSASWTISSDEVRAHIGKQPVDTTSLRGQLANAAQQYRKNRPTE